MSTEIWNNQPLVLYHGTLDYYATAILEEGIDVERGRSFTDFGRGFYTTTLYNRAVGIARAKVIQSTNNSQPALLSFEIIRDDIAGLVVYYF